MNKFIYTAPELELIEMEVEQGFLGSVESDSNPISYTYDGEAEVLE